jgi:hypothetical protein
MALKIYTETLVPQKVEVIPERVERPSIRYSFDNTPLVRGDILEVVIKVNGKEQDTLKYEVTEAIESGKELRPIIFCNIVEMTAFPTTEIKEEIKEI